MNKTLAKSAVGISVSLLLGALVFGTAVFFTNPSYAFYAGLAVAICGMMIVPIVISHGASQGNPRP
jgi:hypothetical protein